MDFNMTLVAKTYDKSQESHLKKFCNECKILDYKNNENFQKIKLDKVNYCCVYDKDKIVAISGTHHEDYYTGKHDWGVWYRVVILPEYHTYFNQTRPYGSSSIAFRICLKENILFAKKHGADVFLFTTNLNNDQSPKMIRQNSHARMFEKLGIIKYLGERDIFCTPQNLWEININNYFNYIDKINENN